MASPMDRELPLFMVCSRGQHTRGSSQGSSPGGGGGKRVSGTALSVWSEWSVVSVGVVPHTCGGGADAAVDSHQWCQFAGGCQTPP